MEKVAANPSTSISTFIILVIAAALFTALIQPSVALTSSGEIIAPRSQSAAEMVAPLIGSFGVLGMAFSLVLNALYTTCLGVIDFIFGDLIPAFGSCVHTSCFGLVDLLFGGWIPAFLNFCFTLCVWIIDFIIGVVSGCCGGICGGVISSFVVFCLSSIGTLISMITSTCGTLSTLVLSALGTVSSMCVSTIEAAASCAVADACAGVMDIADTLLACGVSSVESLAVFCLSAVWTLLGALYTTFCGFVFGLMGSCCSWIFSTIETIIGTLVSCFSGIIGGGIIGTIVGCCGAVINIIWNLVNSCLALLCGAGWNAVNTFFGICIDYAWNCVNMCCGISGLAGLLACPAYVVNCACIPAILSWIWAFIWALITPLYTLICDAGLAIWNIANSICGIIGMAAWLSGIVGCIGGIIGTIVGGGGAFINGLWNLFNSCIAIIWPIIVPALESVVAGAIFMFIFAALSAFCFFVERLIGLIVGAIAGLVVGAINGGMYGVWLYGWIIGAIIGFIYGAMYGVCCGIPGLIFAFAGWTGINLNPVSCIMNIIFCILSLVPLLGSVLGAIFSLTTILPGTSAAACVGCVADIAFYLMLICLPWGRCTC